MCNIFLHVILTLFIFIIGQLHILLRKKTSFRDPDQFSDEEMQSLVRMTKKQFLEYSMSMLGATKKKGDMSIFGETLLFLIKMCHNPSFRLLSIMFSMASKTSAIRIFYRFLIHHFKFNTAIPALIDEMVN